MPIQKMPSNIRVTHPPSDIGGMKAKEFRDSQGELLEESIEVPNKLKDKFYLNAIDIIHRNVDELKSIDLQKLREFYQLYQESEELPLFIRALQSGEAADDENKQKHFEAMQVIANVTTLFSYIISANSEWLMVFDRAVGFNIDPDILRRVNNIRTKNPELFFKIALDTFINTHLKESEDKSLSAVISSLVELLPFISRPEIFTAEFSNHEGAVLPKPAQIHTRSTYSEKLGSSRITIIGSGGNTVVDSGRDTNGVSKSSVSMIKPSISTQTLNTLLETPLKITEGFLFDPNIPTFQDPLIMKFKIPDDKVPQNPTQLFRAIAKSILPLSEAIKLYYRIVQNFPTITIDQLQELFRVKQIAHLNVVVSEVKNKENQSVGSDYFKSVDQFSHLPVSNTNFSGEYDTFLSCETSSIRMKKIALSVNPISPADRIKIDKKLAMYAKTLGVDKDGVLNLKPVLQSDDIVSDSQAYDNAKMYENLKADIVTRDEIFNELVAELTYMRSAYYRSVTVLLSESGMSAKSILKTLDRMFVEKKGFG
jgi:hypothetical protein